MSPVEVAIGLLTLAVFVYLVATIVRAEDI